MNIEWMLPYTAVRRHLRHLWFIITNIPLQNLSLSKLKLKRKSFALTILSLSGFSTMSFVAPVQIFAYENLCTTRVRHIQNNRRISNRKKWEIRQRNKTAFDKANIGISVNLHTLKTSHVNVAQSEASARARFLLRFSRCDGRLIAAKQSGIVMCCAQFSGRLQCAWWCWW